MFSDAGDYQKTEFRFKVLVVGEVFSGKTSFIQRYVENKFISAYKPTIGVDFAMKTLQWDYETKIKLQLWDISGQERCGNICRVYYQNTVGAIIVFDINCNKSFNAVLKWKKQLDDKVVLPSGKPIPCVLIANKCDVESELSILPCLEQFCKENKFCGYYLTSAKDGTNVNESLNFLVEKILDDKEITEILLKKQITSREIRIEKTKKNFCC